MAISKWLKNNSFYSPARAAALSLVGSPRFYNPVSAARLCAAQNKQTQEFKSLIEEIHMIRQEGGLTIWHTPIGELATMETEIAEHVTFLVAECQRDVYLSGPVRIMSDATVLDIGANIGLFAKRAVWAGAQRIISVEPTPGNLLAYRWNLASEIAANRVSVVTTGVWNKADTLRFMVDPRRPARSSCIEPPPEKEAYEISIEVAPLDSIVQDLKLPRVDFIKMDIEGAELNALQGAREILRDKPQLAIAVEHTADRLRNAFQVRELVLHINPEYRCVPGPYMVTKEGRLAPEILYFN